jgi:hypothetical protein
MIPIFMPLQPCRRRTVPTSEPQTSRSRRLLQPFPNTDPGLAGETGISPEGATLYGLDGLKIGGGIEGALSNGAPNRPIWPPPNPLAPPRPAARASVTAAEPSVIAKRRIIALRAIDLCLIF